MKYSFDNPSKRYLQNIEFYKKMHNEGFKLSNGKVRDKKEAYDGMATAQYAHIIKKIIENNNVSSLLEYGCGKAYYYKEKFKIQGKIVPPLKEYWGVNINLYDPCYEKFSKFPKAKVDLSICIDVLEHIPQEDIDWVLDKLFSKTKNFSFLNVACYPSLATLPNGENSHINIQTPDWWLNKLKQHLNSQPHLKIICLCSYKDENGKFPYHQLAINDKLENYL